MLVWKTKIGGQSSRSPGVTTSIAIQKDFLSTEYTQKLTLKRNTNLNAKP